MRGVRALLDDLRAPRIKLAAGGTFVVPPGFDDDSFIIGVRSGDPVLNVSLLTMVMPCRRAKAPASSTALLPKGPSSTTRVAVLTPAALRNPHVESALLYCQG